MRLVTIWGCLKLLLLGAAGVQLSAVLRAQRRGVRLQGSSLPSGAHRRSSSVLQRRRRSLLRSSIRSARCSGAAASVPSTPAPEHPTARRLVHLYHAHVIVAALQTRGFLRDASLSLSLLPGCCQTRGQGPNLRVGRAGETFAKWLLLCALQARCRVQALSRVFFARSPAAPGSPWRSCCSGRWAPASAAWSRCWTGSSERTASSS